MNGRANRFRQLMNDKLKLLSGIGIGIFLFILFFQPFTIDRFDFNNRLLFTAGFGAIVILISLLVQIFFSLLINSNDENRGETFPGYNLEFILILILCSVAFTFYLKYVGFVNITYYVVFKVVVICIFPPLVIKLVESYNKLVKQNESLISERRIIQKKIEKYEEDNLNRSIEFISDNNIESLKLLISEVILIMAADNYVEIHYLEGDNFKKKLIRNTLKNIELQIKQYSNFIRCHRACIVNLNYIEKLDRDFSSHWLVLKGYHERVPVSRQYILKIKETL